MTVSPASRLITTEELCPSCGNFVDFLIEVTGFCASCSPTSNDNPIEDWLRLHANDIETLMLLDISFTAAVKAINLQARPICLVCGRTMIRARRTAVFCRDTPQCRRTSRRYIYYYQNKGMTKAQALSTIMQELDS